MKVLNLQVKDYEIAYTITKANNPTKVYKLGKIDIPENTIIKGRITDFGALLRLLRKRFKSEKLSPSKVNLVFSDMQLFKKRILIPKYIESRDFRKFIDANLQSTILMPVEDPVYYFEMINYVDKENHHIMLYAMSNENYADYQRLMFELHKTIIDFAFESTALIHFENFCGNKDRYKKKNVLLVDIAEEHMHLTIFENYSITYTVVADLNTKELIDCQLDDVYDKKSILYRIYFEIEKVVNFYNVSAGKPIDVTIKTSYPLPEKYIEICAESLGANIHTIKNSKSRLARGKRLIHEETYFKSLGVANKARQKEAQIKLKFKKIKTYGSRLSATILVGIICAFLLLFTTTDFINSLYEYNRVNDSYETRKNELLKLTDINNSIAEFNKFEEIVSVIQNIDQTEVDINYMIDRVATLRREEALISNFSYSANNELVFTYTDVDVEVMYFISRLEKEEWVLAIEYSELFYNEGLAEVRITAIMDSSKITFDALRRDN